MAARARVCVRVCVCARARAFAWRNRAKEMRSLRACAAGRASEWARASGIETGRRTRRIRVAEPGEGDEVGPLVDRQEGPHPVARPVPVVQPPARTRTHTHTHAHARARTRTHTYERIEGARTRTYERIGVCARANNSPSVEPRPCTPPGGGGQEAPLPVGRPPPLRPARPPPLRRGRGRGRPGGCTGTPDFQHAGLPTHFPCGKCVRVEHRRAAGLPEAPAPGPMDGARRRRRTPPLPPLTHDPGRPASGSGFLPPSPLLSRWRGADRDMGRGPGRAGWRVRGLDGWGWMGGGWTARGEVRWGGAGWGP